MSDEITLRDTFAAAALTGLLGSGDLVIDPKNLTAAALTARDAYRWADAMLRERVTEPMPKEKRAEMLTPAQFLYQCSSGTPTNHDAAPAARARTDADRDRTDKAAPRPGEGTGNTHIDIEELLGELHHIAGSEDHVEYDIRRTACDAEHAIDRLRAWVNELQLSRVEIDALQQVVEDGRIASMSVYGHMRSLLVRLRPEWEDESDRSEPISEAAETDPTPPRNGTPAECSAQDGCSQSYEKTDAERGNSNTSVEPVALANFYPDEEMIDVDREYVEQCSDEGEVVPLYRHPAEPCPYVTGKTTRYCTLTPFTLTDAERQAIEWCLSLPILDRDVVRMMPLRKLLERLGGER